MHALQSILVLSNFCSYFFFRCHACPPINTGLVQVVVLISSLGAMHALQSILVLSKFLFLFLLWVPCMPSNQYWSCPSFSSYFFFRCHACPTSNTGLVQVFLLISSLGAMHALQSILVLSKFSSYFFVRCQACPPINTGLVQVFVLISSLGAMHALQSILVLSKFFFLFLL